MRPHKILLTALLILGVASTSRAQENDSREADHQALRALMQRVTTAINTRDIDALGKCFTREFSFTTVDQTRITDLAQLKVYYTRFFDGPEAFLSEMTIQPKAEVATRFVSDNAGYCYGSSDETYTLKNGNRANLNSRWTALMIKEPDGWKVAAAHVGVNFLGKPFKMHYASTWRRLMSWFGR